MIIKKEVEFAKEIGEVLSFAVAIIKVVKEKGDYTPLIGDLVKAIDGLSDFKEEIKNIPALTVTGADAVGKIIELFIKKD